MACWTCHAVSSSIHSLAVLLIDNSNTRTKFCLADAGNLLSPTVVLPTAELTPELLRGILVPWGNVQNVLVSSVVPAVSDLIRRTYADLRVEFLSAETALPFSIRYPKPEQIGADRLANTAGVLEYYGSPAIVVDFGTAVTFDVVDKDGCYVGGVIAPGLGAMTSELGKRTALLPQIQLREPQQAIGRSTEEAMLSGAVHGYRGLVRGILRELCLELGAPTKIVATGGDAELITKMMPEIHSLHPGLTLEGLRIIGKGVFLSET